jgi:hypothetical protein
LRKLCRLCGAHNPLPLKANEIWTHPVGQISDLALDVPRGTSGRRPLDRNSRSSNRVKPNCGVRFVGNRKAQRGLQEKLWDGHWRVSLSSLYKRGLRSIRFLEWPVFRGGHCWLGLAAPIWLVFQAIAIGRTAGSNATTARFAAVATKLRCLGLCKVEMSLGSLAGSVSRRRGDHHIGAAPASAGSF